MLMGLNKLISKDIRVFIMTLKVSLPIAGTRAIAIANALISTMILARADHKALAINAFITTSQLLICGSILSMFTPVSILISKASGQHKEDGIANYMRSSFLLSFFIALIIIFFCKCIGPILRVFKQPVELICLLEEYFDLFTWTVPALVLSQVFTQFYYGTLRTKCIFVINVVSTIIFALVSYILVLSKWASSDMFIQGLGFACIIKFWFNLIALTIYIYSTEMRTYLKKCYTSFSVSFDALKEICCLG